MTVGQQRQRRLGLDALGQQERPESVDRVVDDLPGEAQLLDIGNHEIGQIAPQLVVAPGLLAFAAYRDAGLELAQEIAAVEGLPGVLQRL